jgi:hypothetical protein
VFYFPETAILKPRVPSIALISFLQHIKRRQVWSIAIAHAETPPVRRSNHDNECSGCTVPREYSETNHGGVRMAQPQLRFHWVA